MSRSPDIELTEHEQGLLQEIVFEWTSHGELGSSLRPMEVLSGSLLERGAVPEVRLRYFTDPEYNPGGRGKSRQDIFEKNGTCGDEILAHPNFLKHLEYFVFGPNLPLRVICQFREMAKFSNHLTAGDINDLTPCARAVVRSLRLNPQQAAEEFYKLALECGALPSSAEIIRSSVRQTRI